MPELPDIEAYLAALRPKILDRPIESIDLFNPFFLRTFEPAIETLVGRDFTKLSRLGKRLVFHVDNKTYLVVHLMIAGRLRWLGPGARLGGKIMLAAIRFQNGTLAFTEAGTKRRAMMQLVSNETALLALDPGGLDPLTTSSDSFVARLRERNHTVKRALTDPHILSGIGNAFSDEILHAAKLSPLKWTQKMLDGEYERLYAATCDVLMRWTTLLSERYLKKFPGPGEVTAFRPEFAAHGKYKSPCPVCQTPIQRIRYADNETNYCPTCQNDGKIYADRSLSRLLKDDWPRSVEELP